MCEPDKHGFSLVRCSCTARGGSIMRRSVFRASIRGRDLVRQTGPIRVPTSFRIRIYDDGETVITTRGRFEDSVEGRKYFGGEKREREYSMLIRLTPLLRVLLVASLLTGFLRREPFRQISSQGLSIVAIPTSCRLPSSGFGVWFQFDRCVAHVFSPIDLLECVNRISMEYSLDAVKARLLGLVKESCRLNKKG